MDNDLMKWLDDIRVSVNNINSFLPEKRIFTDFQKDLKTKMAVERNIEIIGEAANRLLKKEPNIAITNARKIVDTRNRISHGYDTLSDDIVWRIVINDLPILYGDVMELLNQGNS